MSIKLRRDALLAFVLVTVALASSNSRAEPPLGGAIIDATNTSPIVISHCRTVLNNSVPCDEAERIIAEVRGSVNRGQYGIRVRETRNPHG
jgi:hypothetical protein